ncbi:MAG: SPOR domain-containing protein [Betaproteobacteria bacterium]|nr:SPOR domain-containing protein [Betaproteobacteria bacterium]
MARAVSDEELQLRKRARRRLIGAIGLVTLVAVFLPMVLDSEPKQVAQDIAITIPAKDQAGAFSSRVVPLQQAPAEPAPTAQPEPPLAPPVPAPAEPAKPAPSGVAETPGAAAKPAPEPRPETEPKPKRKPEVKAEAQSAAPGGYVVQLGAFSNPANVKQLQERLSANGIKSYTEVLKSDKGDRTRVRAGPFSTREAAEKANDKLKKMGLNGIVAPR